MARLCRCAAAAYRTGAMRTAPPFKAEERNGETKGRRRLHDIGGSLLGRCVGRSSNNANANGGLVYAYASNGSSDSYTNNGVRLAFTGVLENESEIDPTMSEAA